MTELKYKPYRAVAPSYLSMFERCPRQFRYARMDYFKSSSADSEVLVFGNFVHYAMEEYLNGGCDSNVAFIRTHCERILPRYDANLVAKVFERARRAYNWVVKEVDGILSSDRTEYISEMKYLAENPFGDSISGRMDLLVYFPDKNKIKVYDFKGTYRVPSDEQLIFYYWAAKHYWPKVDVDLFYLWFTKRLYKKALVTDSVEASISKRIKAVMASVGRGEFPTKKGKHCSWCGHKARCPEFGGNDGAE